MGVTFSTSAFEKQYLSAQDKLEKTMADELTAYINELRKELYQLLLKRTLSKSEYNKIIDKIQSSIGIHTLDVQKNIKDIYIEVLNESRLGNKDYKQAILNYETAKAVNDVTRDFYSAYNNTKQAIDHVKYVMETQSERDKNAIWNNMKNLSREKQQEGIAAYRDLFQKDYEQRIMKELTENPLLNQLITQDDAKLYISLNGKKYDLESYISNRAKYYTTNVATQIERAVDKEQGWTIFRFVRIEDVKVERPHSIHDNEHNDDYFTTDENLIGKEYNGKTLLDAYKAIEDYPYGEQPPFGCRHVWVGVARGIEDKPDGQNEGINPNDKNNQNYNLITTEELNRKWKTEIVNEDENKQFINKIIDNTFQDLKAKNIAHTKDVVVDSKFFLQFGKSAQEIPAMYYDKEKRIYINPLANIFGSSQKYYSFINKKTHDGYRWISTMQFEHCLLHEEMHYFFANTYPKVYKKLMESESLNSFNTETKAIIKKDLSFYASKNKIEFVAEYLVRKNSSGVITTEMKDIYDNILSL